MQTETSTSVQPLRSSTQTMQAVVFHGSGRVSVDNVAKPLVTDGADAIVRVTATTICGSDLHLFHNAIPEMKSGDIMGHECVGIVESVGPEVHNIKVGDRVAVSAVIADGTCKFCQRGQFSLCDTTNPSTLMEKMYGAKTAGLFGYSHLTGGYPGAQAEYLRVPFAEVNLLKLPDAFPDEKAIFLCDVACTAWQ